MTNPVSPLPERSHLLIRGAIILSQDPIVGELARGDIEIRDGVIAAVGPTLDAPGATIIEADGSIAIPGFVDTHWHTWGTLLRGVIGDGPEHGWFARKGALAPHFSPGDTAAGVRLGLAEGLLAGITTVHDWAHNVLSSEDADANVGVLRELGVRAHWTYGAPSGSPLLSADQMKAHASKVGKEMDEPMDVDDIRRIRDDAVPAGDGRLTVGVNVRGPSRSTPEVYRWEFRTARELGLPIAMHCAGTRQEVARIRQVEILDSEGLLGPDVLLAHCIWLSPEEQATVARHRTPISISPLSELRLAMGMPQVRELRAAGVDLSFSLDTTAIAASADPFLAMRVALGLENARHNDATALTPRQALEMATIAGARALGLDRITGSITPGKRADVVLVRGDRLNTAPLIDPAVAVVHSASPANVDTVIVDGRLLVRRGSLVHVDAAAVVAEAEERLAAVCGRAGFAPLMAPPPPAPGAAPRGH
jgi:cytosine/adenosine deaminase-related metal-dependent hydrolase